MTAQLEMFHTGATPYMVRAAVPTTRDQDVHANSRLAYHEETANLSQRAKLVLSFYKQMRRPAHDRECMDALGFIDMNAVRPRITELINAGLLVERGKAKDPITKKQVRLVSTP